MSVLDVDAFVKTFDAELDYGPFDLGGAIEAIKNHKLEEKLSSGISEVLRSGSGKTPKEFANDVQKMMVDFKKTDDEERTDIRSVLDEVLELEADGDLGLSTGYQELDEKTGGLRKGAFWAVGGPPNVGKTGFVVRMADYLCYHGKSVVFYSLEMTRATLGKKLIDYIQKHKRNPNPYDAAMDYKLQVVNQKRTVDQIEHHIRGMEEKPDAIIIDYLHLVGVEGFQRKLEEYERVTLVSQALKNLAGSTNIPVVALAQISNEAIKKQNYDVLGFKGSGSIGFDCDVGVELRRKYELEKGLEIVPLFLWLGKNRYGAAQEEIVMDFSKKTGFIL